MKKKVLAISVGRSDYDRYQPFLEKLNKSNKIKLYLYLSKTHHDPKFGNTLNFISKNLKKIKSKFDKKDFKKDILDNFTEDLIYLIKKIKTLKPNIIFVLGDRYEMLLGPIVSIPKNIPIIHFYGGAITEGATDELVRHAITKMSHFHFVALEEYRKRILQMGEEKWRVKCIGVHELNNLKKMNFLSKKILQKKFNFNFFVPFCLMTFHPVTLELKSLNLQISNLIRAIKQIGINAVITYPNADPSHQKIIETIKKKFKNKKKYLLIKNCGEIIYASILKHAEFIIGNSSSGLVEAATLKKPAVNIGTRQNGKFKPKNVIDADYSTNNIIKSIRIAMKTDFKKKMKKINNPYESKIKIDNIINFIVNLKINDKLLRKKFVNNK